MFFDELWLALIESMISEQNYVFFSSTISNVNFAILELSFFPAIDALI